MLQALVQVCSVLISAQVDTLDSHAFIELLDMVAQRVEVPDDDVWSVLPAQLNEAPPCPLAKRGNMIKQPVRPTIGTDSEVGCNTVHTHFGLPTAGRLSAETCHFGHQAHCCHESGNRKVDGSSWQASRALRFRATRTLPWSHTHLVIAGTVWFSTISHIRSAVLRSVRNAFETVLDRCAILIQAMLCEKCLGADFAWWEGEATSLVTQRSRLSMQT